MESEPNPRLVAARRYVAASGVLFVVLVLAHVARAMIEGAQVFGDVAFVISTLIALAFCAWAARVWHALR